MPNWTYDALSDKQRACLPQNTTSSTNFLRIEIPVELPSPNTFINMFWAKRAKFKKQLIAYIAQSRPQEPYEAVSLKVTRVCKRRVTDPDNEAFLPKPLLDALVRAGVIVDDNKDCVQSFEVEQLTRSQALAETGDDTLRTIVEIEVLW